jgi:hypothetical protein
VPSARLETLHLGMKKRKKDEEGKEDRSEDEDEGQSILYQ